MYVQNLISLVFMCRLNACKVNFDPGLVDRTYLLFNFSEMCPEDVPRGKKQDEEKELGDLQAQASSPLSLNFKCASLDLGVWVPKADTRRPGDIPRFVEDFWSRKVHEEEFRFRFMGLDFRIRWAERLFRYLLTVPNM